MVLSKSQNMPLRGSRFLELFLRAASGSGFREPPPGGGTWSCHNVEAPGANSRELGAVFGAVFHDYIKRI